MLIAKVTTKHGNEIVECDSVIDSPGLGPHITEGIHVYRDGREISIVRAGTVEVMHSITGQILATYKTPRD